MKTDLSTRVMMLHDTLANWTEKNPKLLSGEIAVVFDGRNQLFKVGDGMTRFNDLPYSYEEHFASKLINTNQLLAKNIMQGYQNEVFGIGNIATGYKSNVSALFAQAHGHQAHASSDFSYTWNGDNTISDFTDHGQGTFNINPKDGLSGVYVGEKSLHEIIHDEVPLSGFVKLSSDMAQNLNTNLSIDGFVAVGSAMVKSSPDANFIRYDLPQNLTEQQKQQVAVNSGFRYSLVKPVGTMQSGYMTFQLQDYAVNCIELTGSSQPVKVILPDIVDMSSEVKRAREFIVKIKVTSSLAPSCTFVKSSSDIEVGFETDSTSWQTLSPGVNLFTFNETERT